MAVPAPLLSNYRGLFFPDARTAILNEIVEVAPDGSGKHHLWVQDEMLARAYVALKSPLACGGRLRVERRDVLQLDAEMYLFVEGQAIIKVEKGHLELKSELAQKLYSGATCSGLSREVIECLSLTPPPEKF